MGAPPITGKFTFNLLKLDLVMKVFQNRLYPLVALLFTVPFIASIIGLGLFGPQAPDRNVAPVLVWGLWEPLLVISAFFMVRMWCSVCPVGAVSVLTRRLIGLNMKVPLFLRNYGYWISAAGIAIIYWSEASFDMPHSPRATAILILSIVTLAAVTGLLFQRSSWCRYLCPLGSIAGVLSSCSILELRSNYGICNNDCRTHDCYTGNEVSEGCPMFEGPFSLSSNENCVMCGTCIKICPNRSPVLNLRLPGYELWTVPPKRSFAALAIALIGTQLFRGIEKADYAGLLHYSMPLSWFGRSMLLTGMILLAAFYSKLAGRLVFGGNSSSAEKGQYRIVYVLLPLAFASELGFHIEKLLMMGGQLLPVLGRQLGFTIQLPGYTASTLVVKTLQVFLVSLGALCSAGVIRKVLRLRKDGEPPVRLTFMHYWPVLIPALIYLWMFLSGNVTNWLLPG
jgi:polyferredoxin